MIVSEPGDNNINIKEMIKLIEDIDKNISDDDIVYPILSLLEKELPNGDVCDLIFRDMRNLTPEQVVDEAMKRQAEYVRGSKALP